MDKLAHKYEQLGKALDSLTEALDGLHVLEARGQSFNPNVDYQVEYRTYRDSLIQRFEYSIDLFWKYLKKYLELIHLSTEAKIPSEIIREAFSLKLIGEAEAEKILEMLKSRNMISHMYVEEVAEILTGKIPAYSKILQAVYERLIEKVR